MCVCVCVCLADIFHTNYGPTREVSISGKAIDEEVSDAASRTMGHWDSAFQECQEEHQT